MRALFRSPLSPALLSVAGLIAVLLPRMVCAASKQTAASQPTTWSRSTTRTGKYVPGQLLVRFRHGISKPAIQASHAAMRATVLKQFQIVPDLQLVQLPKGTSTKQAMHYYRARADVLYAEPNYIRRAEQTSMTPNDSLYPEMWNLHNSGQSGGTPGADIHAPEAWGVTAGSSNVVVGVIDTGIDYTHRDLTSNVWSSNSSYTVTFSGQSVTCASGSHGFNAIMMSCDPKDDNGHGTHVSGTIGASTNNGIGVTGINWNVQIIACKFLDQYGSGLSSGVITCLEYLAAMKDRGVNIIATNNSYGSSGFSQAERDAIDSHRRRGIIFVAAAGNASANNDLASFYPANYDLPNIVSVAATDSSDGIASFSDFGRRSVHLGAPGVDILSTVPASLVGQPYWLASGTSMAAPHVVGVAALLKAQDPTRDWKAIKNLILTGGDTLPSLANTITQKRLNAYGSMTCSNSVLQLRFLPAEADVYVWAGGSLDFSFMNIQCGTPNGTIDIAVDGGPEILTLVDDGTGTDLEANDGLYSGRRQWLASEIGDHTLTFPNNDIVTVHVIPQLSLYSYSTNVPFNYRSITGTDLHLRDDDSAVVRPPFPIQFGGVSFPTLNVNSNGNITLFGPFTDWANTALPNTSASVLIAPYWDDLDGQVQWAVTGSAPNRELVIEWQSFATACIWSEVWPLGQAKFQVVFFENSSDVLFNYSNLIFGNYDPLDPFRGCGLQDINAGASATVGIQSSNNLANQFSFSTPSLSNNSAILWQVGPLTPAITQLSPFSVLAGGPVFTLHVFGRSFLPGAVIRWDGQNLPTTFVNAGELTAGIASSNLAAAATAQITVLDPLSGGGIESAPAPFQVYSQYPVPTLTGVLPNPVPLQVPIDPGTPASTVVVLTGTNFVAGSIAAWNGTALPTIVLSGTQLQATVFAALMKVGSAQVTLLNPTPGGGTSNVLNVSVDNPTPVLSSVPRFVGAGAPAFSMRVFGSNFTPQSTLRWNGSDRPTQFLGGISVTASIPASDVASVGSAQVTVFNPSPGGGASAPSTISIVSPPINDQFSNATTITGYSAALTENTVGATASTQDPSPNSPRCNASPLYNQESVWFTFTPPSSGGFVSVNTLGSDYSHEITAWSGMPSALVALGCTFNSYGSYMQAPLGFPVTSTSPIYFMVSTNWMGSAGELAFNLNFGPGFKLDANPTAQEIVNGSSATYTVTVTPEYGSFGSPVALSCNVVPLGPSCDFSQWSVVPGSGAASVTLTAATANMAKVETSLKNRPGFAYWLLLPLFGILVGGQVLPAKSKAAARVLLMLSLILTLVVALTVCGGGSGVGKSAPPAPKPSPRTYKVNIDAGSGSITQHTSVSLTVTF